eukprot:gene15445-32657_t
MAILPPTQRPPPRCGSVPWSSAHLRSLAEIALEGSGSGSGSGSGLIPDNINSNASSSVFSNSLKSAGNTRQYYRATSQGGLGTGTGTGGGGFGDKEMYSRTNSLVVERDTTTTTTTTSASRHNNNANPRNNTSNNTRHYSRTNTNTTPLTTFRIDADDDYPNWQREQRERLHRPCSSAHVPYNHNMAPFAFMRLVPCLVCGRKWVPETLLCTVDPAQALPVRGIGELLEARIIRSRKGVTGEADAVRISELLPFLEYDLQRQVMLKLKIKGMNAVFGYTSRIQLGSNIVVATACATAFYIEALPPPPMLHISRVLKDHESSKDTKLFDMQQQIERLYLINKTLFESLAPGMGSSGQEYDEDREKDKDDDYESSSSSSDNDQDDSSSLESPTDSEDEEKEAAGVNSNGNGLVPETGNGNGTGTGVDWKSKEGSASGPGSAGKHRSHRSD